MQKLSNLFKFIRRQPRWRLIVSTALVVLILIFIASHGTVSASKALTFAARRGPLEVTILEGGSLQALESQESKCEVRVGYQGTKILKIVEEGYLVTDEDVKAGKVLVELDSSDLQKQIIQEEIQYESAVAGLIDAQQSYEIQVNQNQSDIKAAEQKARFARLDLDKFLGENVTAQIVEQVGLDKLLAAANTNIIVEESLAVDPPDPAGASQSSSPSNSSPNVLEPAVLREPATNTSDTAPVAAVAAGPAAGPPTSEKGGEAPERSEPETNKIVIDFTKYASVEALGDGEARQKLRQFADDLQVAQKESGQASTTFDGTRRLFDKGFVPKTEFQKDELAFETSRLKVATAESARDLFLKYDFLKTAEQDLSTYAEAVREYERTRHTAVSKLAQAKAKLKSAQAQYEVQMRQRKDLKEQSDKCTIRAQKAGLVVYGGAQDDAFYYGDQERIREGATVRERQAIITIPDLTHMSVKVKIHESYIKKVTKGQKARITVDAFPDDILTGEVSKVGVLPDSQNRWLNPDLKVYLTTITIDGKHDWVKPGMSAKVEIMVNKLNDCLYVPVQAVWPEAGKQVCYLAHGLKHERREVQVGDFNDEFIEVKSGLKEGDHVLLRPPEGVETGKEKDSAPPAKDKAPPPKGAKSATSAKPGSEVGSAVQPSHSFQFMAPMRAQERNWARQATRPLFRPSSLFDGSHC